MTPEVERLHFLLVLLELPLQNPIFCLSDKLYTFKMAWNTAFNSVNCIYLLALKEQEGNEFPKLWFLELS